MGKRKKLRTKRRDIHSYEHELLVIFILSRTIVVLTGNYFFISPFMRSRIGSSIIGFGVLAAPIIAQAQNIESVTSLVSSLVNYAIGILIGVAIIAFFVGLIKYLFNSKGEDRKAATNLMVFGILALFVMLSIFGLVRLLQNTFGVGQGTLQQVGGSPSIGGIKIQQQ